VPFVKGTFFPDPAPHPVNKPVRMKTTANLRVNTTPAHLNFRRKNLVSLSDGRGTSQSI
jgi:hypothetical protein